MIIEGSHLEPAVLMRYERVHNYTFYRLDEHDARRFVDRDGWDAYSPIGTYARIDRLATEHEKADHELSKYSVKREFRRNGSSSARTLKPSGDGVRRWQLEKEMLAVRGMRHVFQWPRGMSLQGWVTVLNPILPHGYPPQLVLTLEDDLTEPVFPHPFQHSSPEARAAALSGRFRDPKLVNRLKGQFAELARESEKKKATEGGDAS